MLFFDQTSSSDLNRKYGYLDGIHYFAGHQIPLAIKNILMIICIGSYMIYINNQLSFIVLCLLCIQITNIKL